MEVIELISVPEGVRTLVCAVKELFPGVGTETTQPRMVAGGGFSKGSNVFVDHKRRIKKPNLQECCSEQLFMLH